MRKKGVAILLCAVFVSGCGASRAQQIEEANVALKAYSWCYDAAVKQHEKDYADVDLVVRLSAQQCEMERHAMVTKFIPLHNHDIYKTEEAGRDAVARVEQKARTYLLKRDADLDKAWAADPVPMELK